MASRKITDLPANVDPADDDELEHVDASDGNEGTSKSLSLSVLKSWVISFITKRMNLGGTDGRLTVSDDNLGSSVQGSIRGTVSGLEVVGTTSSSGTPTVNRPAQFSGSSATVSATGGNVSFTATGSIEAQANTNVTGALTASNGINTTGGQLQEGGSRAYTDARPPTAAAVGADPAGTASSEVAAHEAGAGVHPISGVTGLQAALDSKADASSVPPGTHVYTFAIPGAVDNGSYPGFFTMAAANKFVIKRVIAQTLAGSATITLNVDGVPTAFTGAVGTGKSTIDPADLTVSAADARVNITIASAASLNGVQWSIETERLT